MLEGKIEPNFERAVFMSENPYHNGKFTYKAFQNSVTEQLQVIQQLIEANDKSDSMDFNAYVNEYGRFKLADIRYLPHQKKELYRQAISNWAVFKHLTDNVLLKYTFANNITLSTPLHKPFAYAISDPFGMKDWSNSQVLNLLISNENKGNCFALTALYKILSDRLNANARICTAPQHIYIQHQDPKGQYYNVELATAGHPGDGIIQTLTYTPSEAIMSGIALRDYSTKQSIGLCLVNLAKSYEHKFNTKDNEFLLRCAELALTYDSLNLNALLLKQQVMDTRVTNYAAQHHLNSIAKLKHDKGILPLVNKLEKHTALLYNLGYREMPHDMQEQIMHPFGYDTKKWNHVSQNARPFTSIKIQDPKDEEYWTLTKGMFKEIWEPTAQETYGHYTLTTATGKLKTIDTTTSQTTLIDPVAFAYDFGARIYDARIGHFVSTDPHASKYPALSPYAFVANNPINAIDPDGRDIIFLKNTKGAHGYGHAAVLIGNKTAGWVYISMNGTGEGSAPFGKSQNPDIRTAIRDDKGNIVTDPALAIGWANVINKKEKHEYDDSKRIETSASEDLLAINAASKAAAEEDYGICGPSNNSCIDVSQAAFAAIVKNRTSDESKKVPGSGKLIPNNWFESLEKFAEKANKDIASECVKIEVTDKCEEPKQAATPITKP